MMYQEGLRVAWLVFWRLSVLNHAASYLIKGSRELFCGSPETATDFLFFNLMFTIPSNLFAVFVSTPLVVHMMMRKEYKGFHLEIVRSEAQDRSRRMHYRESLRAAWLLWWPQIVVAPILGALVGSGIVRGPESWFGYSCIQGVHFAIMALIVHRLVRKQFQGFRLRIVRSNLNDAPTQETSASAQC